MVQLCKILVKRLIQVGFEKHFQPINKLDQGNYGVVYLSRSHLDDQYYAVKASLQLGQHENQSINEINVIRNLDHHNILKYHTSYSDELSLYVVLELLEGKTLRQCLINNEINTSQQILSVLKGILIGLKYIHSQKIVHRDIKLDNVMFKKGTLDSDDVTIVDFGLATNICQTEQRFKNCGTPGYVAPEIISLAPSQNNNSAIKNPLNSKSDKNTLNSKSDRNTLNSKSDKNSKSSSRNMVNPKSDVYSTGVVLHYMLFRKGIFMSNDFYELYDMNKKGEIDWNDKQYEKLHPDCLTLLRKMLETKMQDRWSVDQCLNSKVFNHGQLWGFKFQIQKWENKYLNDHIQTVEDFNRCIQFQNVQQTNCKNMTYEYKQSNDSQQSEQVDKDIQCSQIKVVNLIKTIPVYPKSIIRGIRKSLTQIFSQ